MVVRCVGPRKHVLDYYEESWVSEKTCCVQIRASKRQRSKEREADEGRRGMLKTKGVPKIRARRVDRGKFARWVREESSRSPGLV